MKRFLIKLSVFALSLLGIILFAFCLPLTPREKTSYLWVKTYKDSLLRNTLQPRIIFVGGSNLTFGLNSQMIKDSLNLNPINTALSANLGLAYMMDHTAKYVKKGDVIVLVPEYEHFFGSELYGTEPLLRSYLYFDTEQWSDFRFEQKKSMAKAFLPYVLSKFQPNQYIGVKERGIYTKYAYNKYGDVDCHWSMKQRPYISTDTIVGAYNPDALLYIQEFQQKLRSKGATLLFSYPSYEYSAYRQDSLDICFVEQKLNALQIPMLGTPKRYAFPDSLMFNSCYHLLKEAVDQRTNYLIEDLRAYLSSR